MLRGCVITHLAIQNKSKKSKKEFGCKLKSIVLLKSCIDTEPAATAAVALIYVFI